MLTILMWDVAVLNFTFGQLHFFYLVELKFKDDK